MHADHGLWIPDWQPGPARPVLDDGTCHVWRVDLEQVAARLAAAGVAVDDRLGPGISSLDEAELARRSRFVFERHRRWFLAARTALRGVLGAYLDLDAAAVPIVAPPHQRPTLAAGARATSAALDFNLSHSDSLALIAVARRAPLGVDVEWVRSMDDALELAQRHYLDDELAQVSAAGGAARDRAFFTCWTRKEAVLKSTGAGLSVAPSTFRVGATPEPLQMVFEDPAGALPLRVVSFEVRDGALGACAMSPEVRLARMFDYVP